MEFGPVESFVEKAQAAGQTIYGHTLAWHSQQNNKYLNNIIADIIDPNYVPEYVPVTKVENRTCIIVPAGEKVENFVFNFYDYILWKEQKTVDFEFSYRTSVEHFYPQHPIDNKVMDDKHLHSFGNLCLVSNSMNSKFSNSLPAAKYHNFGTDREQKKTYSIKLQNMMQSMRDHDKWDEGKIGQESKFAKDLMMKYLFQL
jgi:hypothetical protein